MGTFSKDGLHLNKRGAAVLGKGFLRAMGDGIGKLPLNYEGRVKIIKKEVVRGGIEIMRLM